jgi:hypothetical protein
MTKQKPNKLPDLQHFTGTETWWRHPLHKDFLYTDGIRHVAQSAEAYWLLDVIFSHARAIQNNKEIDQTAKLFLVFNLAVADDDSAIFTTEDGNKNIIKTACQKIPFTDFPAKRFTCWMSNKVCLLPSEY